MLSFTGGLKVFVALEPCARALMGWKVWSGNGSGRIHAPEHSLSSPIDGIPG